MDHEVSGHRPPGVSPTVPQTRADWRQPSCLEVAWKPSEAAAPRGPPQGGPPPRGGVAPL